MVVCRTSRIPSAISVVAVIYFMIVLLVSAYCLHDSIHSSSKIKGFTDHLHIPIYTGSSSFVSLRLSGSFLFSGVLSVKRFNIVALHFIKPVKCFICVYDKYEEQDLQNCIEQCCCVAQFLFGSQIASIIDEDYVAIEKVNAKDMSKDLVDFTDDFISIGLLLLYQIFVTKTNGGSFSVGDLSFNNIYSDFAEDSSMPIIFSLIVSITMLHIGRHLPGNLNSLKKLFKSTESTYFYKNLPQKLNNYLSYSFLDKISKKIDAENQLGVINPLPIDN